MSTTKKPTVLIVEDEPRLLEELTAALVADGFSVKSATDGEMGLKILRKEKPSIVVLDLILPKVDGFKVLEEAKKDPETATVPVLVLSNLETPENIERAVRLGAASYLVKPNYEISHILEKIRATLKD